MSDFPTLPDYLRAFFDRHSCFHDPIFPRKVMENPVIIPGDKNSYDKASLAFWEEECIKNGNCRYEESGKRLILCPSNFQLFYDPATVTENANLKQALRENSAVIREHYMRMFPDAATNRSITEIFDAMVSGIPNSRGISSQIFSDLDVISKLDLFKTLKLKPPQIIVLGSENNGKSTLLERLIGFSIFPARETEMRAGGACTICPIRVHLRRSDSELLAMASIKIRNRITGVERNTRAVPIINVSSVLKQVMEDMRNYAPRENPCFANRPSLIVDEEIVVEIKSPTCPNLDILDLPGLCAAELAAWQLADQILADEKDHSIVLMVVKETTINQSTAPELILKHNLCDKTTGVFTFIDKFWRDPENDDGPPADELLLDLFRPPQNRADNHFNQIFWMGCSNAKPKEHALMHETVRLLKTDEKEAAFVRNTFPKFLNEDIFGSRGKELLGVPAIKARLEAEYEKYICNRWSFEMIAHLEKHFFKLSDKNLRLGLPMLKIEEYELLVNKLKTICRENDLFSTYDLLSMFRLHDANTSTNIYTSSSLSCGGGGGGGDQIIPSIKDIVINRASPICANLQWLRLQECHSINANLGTLGNVQIPAGKIDFDSSFIEVEKAERAAIDLLNKMAGDVIVELGNSAGEKFVEAALGNKKVVVDYEFGWSIPEVASLMSNVKELDITSFPADLQTSILQMELIPGLKENYRAFINQKILEVNDAFKEYSTELISKLEGKLVDHDHFISEAKVELKFVDSFISNSRIISMANGPKSIGNEFLTFWLSSLRSKLSSFTKEWAVPETCFEQYIETPAYEMRKKLTEDMLDVAFAIKAIKDLQRRARLADTSSDDVTSVTSVRQMACN